MIQGINAIDHLEFAMEHIFFKNIMFLSSCLLGICYLGF